MAETREAAFQRTRESSFEFARLRGLALAPVLEVSGAAVNESFGVLANALGLNWLTRVADTVPHGRALPFRRHPIGDLISTAGPTQVAELVELGQYLVETAHMPGSALVVEALKGQQYRQTLLHLAFASMARRAGAKIIRLEPPTAGGRLADIELDLDGVRAHAECYRPTVKIPEATERILLAQQVLDVVKDRALVFSVAITVTVEPTPTIGHQVIEMVRQLADDVERRAQGTDGLPQALIEDGPIVVSVSRGVAVAPGMRSPLIVASGFPIRDRDPSLFMRTKRSHAADLVGIGGDVDRGQNLSSVGVWLPVDLIFFDPLKVDS
jgi:hypothetical protein